MSENKRDTKKEWVAPDDAPEFTDETFDQAEITVAGKVIRPATGTIRRVGRPRLEYPKEHINLRVDRDVLDRFRADGPGWQSRMNEALRKTAGLE